MNFQIETLENWQRVMMFIGRNVDYKAAYLPNLPNWGMVFAGEMPDMKLIVATQRDGDAIVACAVRQVYTGSTAQARLVNPDFAPVVWLGDFGSVSAELSDFAETVAGQYVVP